LLSLGVLFFYCSHLLESTVLNLELYFEHRNYLAVAFILPGVVSAAYTRMKRPVFWLAISCVLLALSGFTRYSTTIWSSYPAMVEVAARKAPLSVRAQARYAASLFNAGQYDVSLEVLDNAIRDIPGEDPLLLVNRLTILCELGVLTHEESRVLTEALSRTHYDPRMIKVYSTLLIAVTDGSCPGVKIEAFVDMFAKMLDVPSNGNPDSLEFSQIKYFLGVSLMTAGRPADALTAFEASLTARPDASSAMKMAATMATAGYYDEALKLSGYALDQIETHGASGLTRPTVNRSDIEYFRSVVREDRENAMNVRDADTVDPTR
jgi:tetratricopeptide (TPR) repeat protein